MHQNNPYPASAAHLAPWPGTNGRWCEGCQEYKIFAILERIGCKASEADYIPRCPTCGNYTFTRAPG